MATIRKFLDDLSGQSEQQKAAEQEVALLVKMAEYKLDTLETQIRNKFLNRQLEDQIEIVGDRLGAFTKGYRVNVQTGAVGDAIKGIVNNIMMIGDAGAKEIIGGVITNALDAMFSSVGVEDRQEQLFVITFAGMALVRYDFYVWKYESSSNGLFKNTKSVVAYTYASSVVDHKKVNSDQLGQAIYNSFGSNASPEKVAEYAKKLKEAYDALNAISGENALAEFKAKTEKAGSLKALIEAEKLPERLRL